MKAILRPFIGVFLGLPLLASAQLFDKTVEQEAVQVAPSEEQAVTASEQTDQAVSSLANYIDQTNTLTGNFVQVVYSDRGEERSGGQFWLKRPGKFFWDYQTPYAQKIISDGQKVTHYDIDLAQVSITNREELSGDVAMNLLVGDKKLSESFHVKQQTPNNAPVLIQFNDQGLQYFKLEPLNSNEDIDQVWVVMQNGALSVIYIDTGVGQQSLISLQNVTRNAAIADSQFRFKAPEGVDVIGG
ncbi:outer membrane lipoprotein chaperone LolA [Suttonella sp. R2A3]|uniref:outer membrane lipoprotein chaperone LolA n=1 Tax=Suttonella sp. R2A3 TaxID=2908648 RepID=UPI001F2E6721|nr:outer membrane lipoprotein chaperone LolA [Suttonella sp. R2A3]UJF24817.1 outer membrane lipoprotein chaperone LolA [Suttonella sp. R2A3]